MAIEDQMNELQQDGLTDAEKAGIEVEVLFGKDDLSAGKLPTEGQEGTAPPPTQAGENLIIPVEEQAAPQTDTEMSAAPPVQQELEPETPLSTPYTGPVYTAGVSPQETSQPFRMPNIVGSAVNATIESVRGDDGRPDPLRVPDPFMKENGQILYDMFFKHDDPSVDAQISATIGSAVGFIRAKEGDRMKGLTKDEVIPFPPNYTVLDRTRLLVAAGGTNLVFPQVGPDNTYSIDATGGYLYNAETALPIMQDLDMYRREAESDVDIEFDSGTLRLMDLPRSDFTPEGQKQLDNFLQVAGLNPYERVLVNRAEYSGYLKEVIGQGTTNDIYAIPQNIVTGIVNAGHGGIFSFMSDFANVPDEVAGPMQLGDEDKPFIPYAPTFSQELSERLGISEADAEALQSYSGDALTRGMRIAKETLPILMSLWGGRALRDKKMQDKLINFAKQETGAKDETEILAKLVSQGKTLDSLVGDFIKTQVSAPISILKGAFERSAVRALQRASSPQRRLLVPTKETIVEYNKQQIRQLENAIGAVERRVSNLTTQSQRTTPMSNASLELKAAQKQLDDLVARRDKMLNRSIKDLLPESIGQIVKEEGLAIGGAVLAGQAYQDLVNNSSEYLNENTVWAEAFGSVIGAVFVPALWSGTVFVSKAGYQKLSQAIDSIIVNTDPTFTRKFTTGDSGLDAQIDRMYRGMKAADPSFQEYILDQFDTIRGLRDQLSQARGRDGELLLSPQDVQLTFSQLSGMMLFDAYSSYIVKNISYSELSSYTNELMRLEQSLVEKMGANNALARSIQKITAAGIEAPQLGPVAKMLQGFVDQTSRNIDRSLSVTNAAIKEQADMAKTMLKGDPVIKVDEETGEMVTLNLEAIFQAEDQAIINTGLKAGDSLDIINQRLVENSAERLQMYREGLAVGRDVFTAQDGLSSAKMSNGFWLRRNTKWKEVSGKFDTLRSEYPDHYADGRFLIDWINQNSPDLMTELGQEVTVGARNLADASLPTKVPAQTTKVLSEAYRRLEEDLITRGVDPSALEQLKGAAGVANNGLQQFINIDKYLRSVAADPEEGPAVAKALLGDVASTEDLIALADNLELPLNFSDVHLIASALGKMASKYEGTPRSVSLTVMRENFFDNLASPTYGFRDANGDFAAEEILTKYSEARQFADVEYYQRFSQPGTWSSTFAQSVGGNSEGLPTHTYKIGNEPSKQLPKLLNGVDGFNTRYLDPEVDGDTLGELEASLARVWGEYDPVSGTYYIDLDSPEAKDLANIFQGYAAEQFLKSPYAKELLDRTKKNGFDVVREILKLTDPVGEYNPYIVENLTKIQGRRRNPDGTLSAPQAIIGSTDIGRAIDIDRVNLMDEETRALTNAAITEVQKRSKLLMDEGSTEARALQKKLKGFEVLSDVLAGENQGQQIYAMIRSNPQKIDQLRDVYMQEAVTSGLVDTFDEAAQVFNDAVAQALGQTLSDRFVKFEGRSVFREQMKSIRDPEEMARFLGAEDANVEAMMRQIFGDEHYNSLRNVADFYAGTIPMNPDVKFLMPTDLTPEALYSRLNNINRGVAGIRWTVTEFLMRSLRSHKSSVLEAMFSSPDVAEVFEAVVLQNKEITPSMWAKAEEALVSLVSQSLVVRAGIYSSDIGEVEPDVRYRQQLQDMRIQGGINRPVPEVPVSP